MTTCLLGYQAEAIQDGEPTPAERANGANPGMRDTAAGDLAQIQRNRTFSDPPVPQVVEPAPSSTLRRRQTAASRRSTVRDGRTDARTTRRTRRTTLAGPEDGPALRTAHEPFVHPGYADLNPEYEQPQNTKPVWSLAKPLPRVVRPGMVPTRQEVIQQSLRPELPAENSAKVGADVDPNELEAGRMDASLNPVKVSAQVKDARAQRENNFLNKLQSGELAQEGSRMSRQQSTRVSRNSSTRRRRNSEWDPRNDALSTTYEEDEPDSQENVPARQSKRQERPPEYRLQPGDDTPARPADTAIEDHASMTTLGDDDLGVTDAPLQSYHGEVEPLLQELVEEEVFNHHTSWSVWRTEYREPLAELLGVIVQLIIGFCSDLAVTAANAGNPNTTDWAWGFATMLGIYVSGGISGAHLNPAVTIMLWFYRGFPKRKMPEYFAAQFLGAFIAAFAAYGVYYASIQAYLANNDASGIINSFVTNQREVYIDRATAFFNEFLGTTVLAIAILALGDDQNAPPGAGMNAVVIGFLIMVLSIAFAFQTGAALNPSRDFGPRLALLCLGYGGELFRDPYWFYGPFAAAITGAMFGAFLYDFAIFTGGESPIN